MSTLIRRLAGAATLILLVFSGANASVNNVVTKVQLQSAMQQHIDQHLVNGTYLHFEAKTGKVLELHPGAAHPTIMKMGNYFVLCSDFRDQAGKSVNVDFYLAPNEDGYVVFESIVNNRQVLGRLMKAGHVEPFE